MSPADLPWWGWLLCAGGGVIASLLFAALAEPRKNPELLKASEHFNTCVKCQGAIGDSGYCPIGEKLKNVPYTIGGRDPAFVFLSWVCGAATTICLVIASIRFVKWVWEG
jgi:hypothetical protein